MNFVFRVLCFFLPILFGLSARAITFQYPVGHIEAMTSGVGIALLGSAAGLVYNPASLGGIKSSAVSLSGSTFFVMQSDYGENGEARSLQAVPNTTLGAWRLGSGSLVAGIVVPGNLDVSIKGDVVTNGVPLRLQAHSQTSQNLAGVSWGQPLLTSDECSVCGLYAGVSVLASYATHKMTVSTFFPSTSNLVVSNSDTSATSLIVSAGTIWRASPRFGVGIKLQLPSVLLDTTAEGSTVTQTGTSASTRQTSQTFGASNMQRLEQLVGTVGVEWHGSRRVTLLADMTMGERPRSLSSNNERAPVFIGAAGRYRLFPNLVLRQESF